MSKLNDALSKIQKSMRDGATGNLVAALAVVDIVAHWSQYEAEAGGKTALELVHQATNQSVAFFERRARAVEVLGRDVLGWMEDTLAVWLVGNAVPHERRAEVLRAIIDGTNSTRKRGLPVGMSTGKRIAIAILKKPAKVSRTAA